MDVITANFLTNGSKVTLLKKATLSGLSIFKFILLFIFLHA